MSHQREIRGNPESIEHIGKDHSVLDCSASRFSDGGFGYAAAFSFDNQKRLLISKVFILLD